MAHTPRFSLPLLVLLLLTLSGTPTHILAQGGPTFSATPGAISTTVALGATAEVELRLRNSGSDAAAPRLFEAQSPASPAALPTSARVPVTPQAQKVEPALRDVLDTPGVETTFLVFLAEQAELAPAYAIEDWTARGAFVYRTLREHAERTQGELRALLQRRGADYTPLWIVNALAVHGDADDVSALAARAEVAALRSVRAAALGAAVEQPVSGACAPDAANRCWNVNRVGAARVWDEFGVGGQGVTVAVLDSGARFDHPALLGAYRGNRGGTISHAYNWHDVQGGQLAPVDSATHGTHVLGTIVGAGRSASEPAVGVAPGANWIAVRACGTEFCSELNLLLGAQWLLAPTDLNGVNPRPELRPHVINSAWSSGQDAGWFAGYTAAWRAAGIVPVFAAGNKGNLTRCATVLSPGDYADVVAVGATDGADVLAAFSGTGPGPNGRIKPDLVAPGSGIYSTMAPDSRPYGALSGTSMATPHVSGAVALLLSANPALIGNYEAVYGALVGAALPRTGDERFGGEGTEDCPTSSSPNNVYGYGRLDAYAAVARVTTDVPWLALPPEPLENVAPGGETGLRLTLDARRVPGPGVYSARVLVHGPELTRPPLVIAVQLEVPSDPSHASVGGQLTRAADGRPLAGSIEVSGGARVASDAEGRFSLTLPPAAQPYSFIATARDAIPASASLLLAPGDQATLDFALNDDAPLLVLDAAPRSAALAFGAELAVPLLLRNEGSRPLSYTLRVPSEPFGIWRSDEPGGPPAAWSEPPPDAVTLALTDDGASGAIPIGFRFPFTHSSYEQLYVGANGVISFSPLPVVSVPFARTCLPLSETAGDAIAPLRLDLNPSVPDARVSYARSAEGFLVSWENVPLYAEPSRRLSFQALLMPDGRISMRYRSVGDLPPGEAPSYGVQFASSAPQTLGCREDLRLGDGLVIELRPQPATSLWLGTDRSDGLLAPGETVTAQITLRWATPAAGGWSLRGGVVVQSNDPSRRTERVGVELTPEPAPHRLFLPRISVLAP